MGFLEKEGRDGKEDGDCEGDGIDAVEVAAVAFIAADEEFKFLEEFAFEDDFVGIFDVKTAFQKAFEEVAEEGEKTGAQQ